MREECGKCDENEEHEALFVLPLLMFTAKKMVFFLLVFVFVRIKVCAFCVVAKPLLVKEVITERERERDYSNSQDRPKCVIPSPPFVSLQRCFVVILLLIITHAHKNRLVKEHLSLLSLPRVCATNNNSCL